LAEIEFDTIDLEQIDMSDQQGFKQALSLLQNRVKRGFVDAGKKISGGENVTVNVDGQEMSLNDAMKRGLCRVGTILIMYISWGEAIGMEQSGWVPADGDNGTPPWIVNSDSGGNQRYVKAVAYGKDPWDGFNRDPKTGGGVDLGLGVDDHALTVCTGKFQPCAGGCNAVISVSIDAHTLTGLDGYDPPHIEAIPMMRVR
jgi:hypothetical protein